MRRLLALLILLAGLAVIPGARAETVDAARATLGARTERSELVVRAAWTATERKPDGLRHVRFQVLEVLRGEHSADEPLTVVHTVTASGEPWRAHRDHLLFLRRTDDGWASVAGTLGLVTLGERGADGVAVTFVRTYAACLDDGGAVRRADELTRLLVRGGTSDDDGLAGACATDLVRHAALLDRLSTADRAALTASFARETRGPAARAALAPLLVAARCPGARDALLDAASRADGRPLRVPLGAALAGIDDTEIPTAIAARLASDAARDAVVRGNLVHALGSLAPGSGALGAVDVVEPRLRDADPGVRAQAAHALGRLARTLRAADESRKLENHASVAALLTRAKSTNERRAAAWCLAQFDTREAFDLLRRFAKSDARADVRRVAQRYLERPRLRLILR